MAREVSAREPAWPCAGRAVLGCIHGGCSHRSAESGPRGWAAGVGHSITLGGDLHPSAERWLFAGIPGKVDIAARGCVPDAALHLPPSPLK